MVTHPYRKQLKEQKFIGWTQPGPSLWESEAGIGAGSLVCSQVQRRSVCMLPTTSIFIVRVILVHYGCRHTWATAYMWTTWGGWLSPVPFESKNQTQVIRLCTFTPDPWCYQPGSSHFTPMTVLSFCFSTSFIFSVLKWGGRGGLCSVVCLETRGQHWIFFISI